MKSSKQDYLIKMKHKQKLQDRLLLNQFICSLFRKNIKSIEGFQSFLSRTELEGIDEETAQIRFTKLIKYQFPNMNLFVRENLDQYDQNIQEYLQKINFKREEPIQLKYYQYLAILFTEIFLDKYYNYKEEFIDELGEFAYKYNENKQEKDKINIEENDLSKLCYWSATGSGKTFFIHINYLQILKYNKQEVDNILLITPNESLTTQHLEEFKQSNIPAKTFENKNLLSYGEENNSIKIIEITKLTKEKKGKGDGKSIQLEQFGEHNIIFVDEGHRGSSGKEWKENREKIKGKGFMFEYSATFGQVANSNETLFNEYRRSIIFDYSYNYFHRDGFGKDYSIFNLEKGNEDYSREYFIGSLLSFYEQKRYYKENKEKLDTLNIKSPLMLYVGSKVNTQETSDIKNVLEQFLYFINNKERSIQLIKNNLNEKQSNLLSGTTPIFQDKFPYLKEKLKENKLTEENIYDEILLEVFSSKTNKTLEVHNMKKSEGEIGLKLGDDYFGVINVGDSNKFLKLIQEELDSDLIKIEESNFHDSLFETIDDNHTLNFLIGSKKFMEGWNSFRVSQICLLNLGKSEGSQVIQLFGRGVRLRGYNNLLKRTKYLALDHQIPESVEVPKYVSVNETLNIFGLNAKYIEVFKEILEKEGIREIEELIIPIRDNNIPTDYKLFIPKVPDSNLEDFKRESISVESTKFDLSINLDLRAKIKLLESKRDDQSPVNMDNHYQETPQPFNQELIEYLDFDKIILETSKFKEIKKFHNLYFDKNLLKDILKNEKIQVYGNKNLMKISEVDSIDKINYITEYAIQILKSYLSKYYTREKSSYMKDKYEYEYLDREDENFFPIEYILTYEKDNSKVEVDFNWIKSLVENEEIYNKNNKLYRLRDKLLDSYVLKEHLYKPLIFKDENESSLKDLKITPNALVKSERNFVKDLAKYVEDNKEFFNLEKIFLLRNPPRKGVGFFNSKNFYPDFILWTRRNEQDQITFIDPKGLIYVNLEDFKVELSQDIKEIEENLNQKEEKNIILNSFILSATSFTDVKNRNPSVVNQKELEDRHILFLEDPSYLSKMFDYISGIGIDSREYKTASDTFMSVAEKKKKK